MAAARESPAGMIHWRPPFILGDEYEGAPAVDAGRVGPVELPAEDPVPRALRWATRPTTMDPMALTARHHPMWLRSAREPTAASGGTSANDTSAMGGREVGAWKMWERVRAFDRRYATVVDVALAAGLFILCSGWLVEQTASRPSLWFVAGLTFPLVLRRRAPMAVFLVIATVAFIQWTVTVPGLADASLLVALSTVALECAPLLVTVATLIAGAGVVMATVRWVPTGNHLQSLVFLSGLVVAAVLAGVTVRALRRQLDWLAERAQRLEIERDQQASLAAAAERARIAREMHDVVSHNLQVMVTLADAASAAAEFGPPTGRRGDPAVSSTGRQALVDMRRMLGVLREESPAGAEAPLAPQPGLGDLDALAERVRGTGLPVTVERSGRSFEVSEAAGLTIYRIVQEALTNVLKHAGRRHGSWSASASTTPMSLCASPTPARTRSSSPSASVSRPTPRPPPPWGHPRPGAPDPALRRRKAAATACPEWPNGRPLSAALLGPGHGPEAAGRSRPRCATAKQRTRQ